MNKQDTLNQTFSNKKILVTGATGSIGSGLVRTLLKLNPTVIRLFTNDENALFGIEQELKQHSNLRFLVGDVREKERLRLAMTDVDYVFHAAALKHVPLCEYNPFEAVKTNVIGTQNVLQTALDANVEKVITISTDKAVSPVNVMGATKLLAERVTIAANHYKGTKKTKFSCVRFGNVLCSRGSVVPVFKEQIKNGGPVTLTEPTMLRFVMSITSAIHLVLSAASISEGGEIFIFKMPTLQISDLAEVMIENFAHQYGYCPKDIAVKIIGKRSGERLYEDLMTEDEAICSFETDDMFVVMPSCSQITETKILTKKYSSKDAPKLTKQEVSDLLSENLKFL